VGFWVWVNERTDTHRVWKWGGGVISKGKQEKKSGVGLVWVDFKLTGIKNSNLPFLGGGGKGKKGEKKGNFGILSIKKVKNEGTNHKVPLHNMDTKTEK